MNQHDTTLLSCEEMGPANATKSVIWLHGLGASGHDFVPIVPQLNRPDTRFVFPHAPTRPVTINMGHVMPSWYDILRLDSGPGRESESDILQSTAHINALIKREIERGVPPAKVVLAGFSQGGAMALHAGIRSQHGLAGIMVLSAYDLREHTRAREAHASNSNTPILFCHGTRDAVVSLHKGQNAYETYQTLDRDVQWLSFNMGHEVCHPQIIAISKWLGLRLGG
jgi:phospholipase/carboxylesterase